MSLVNQDYVIESIQSSACSEGDYDRVINSIREVYLWFSSESTDADIRRRLQQHPDARIDLLLNQTNGFCEGFTVHYTEMFQGHRVMFRGGTVVKHRSNGHYKWLLERSVRMESPDFLVAMTQNPRVYETLRSFSPTGRAYPDEGLNPTDTIRSITKRFCKVPTVNLDTMIVRDVYSNIRKDDSFKTSRDPAVARLFSENLGVDDGFFVVVPIK
jgi:hypothetical protein